jgi:hypothetical protein
MFKKNRKLVNYLEMIPVRNVQEFTEEAGKITLLVPKFRHGWMLRWLVPAKKSKHFRVHLDEMGSRVWKLIDGQQNVGQICGLLENAGNEENPVENALEMRVTGFLTQLYKNRFVVFRKAGDRH